jgi:hypothetical protein
MVMVEPKPHIRDCFIQMLEFTAVSFVIIGAIIRCRNEAHEDTFFQNEDVKWFFELFHLQEGYNGIICNGVRKYAIVLYELEF